MINTNNKNKYVILDGTHFVYRAFYAIQNPLKTSSGEPTNALYGFLNMLLNILEIEKPDYITVVFDEKAPTFRHKEYDGYKANRTKAPDELYIQIPFIKDMLNAFSVPIYSLEGYEADDLMGTFSHCLKSQNYFTLIASGDMDMMQLIDDDVVVAFPHKGYKEPVYYNSDTVFKKYNIYPNQIIDYKSLIGDNSDNIKGVDGIGPKGASALLNKYKSLENIYNNLDKIAESSRKKLIRYKDQAFRAQRLTTILLDAPCILDIKKGDVDNLDYRSLINFCEKMELKTTINRIKKTIPQDKLEDSSQMQLF